MCVQFEKDMEGAHYLPCLSGCLEQASIGGVVQISRTISVEWCNLLVPLLSSSGCAFGYMEEGVYQESVAQTCPPNVGKRARNAGAERGVRLRHDS